ncbi:SGNH/GDSL hydrolase family protein [Nocardioides sp.]|uniref:SGNH/GDSL hydrolase family protein n=1 Tax=Nocardioides sp. TaxID=35761 RepID=UPI003D1231C8
MGFQRYVALGDSFTEGVGDLDPERPNGVRGWADRVAEVLATRVDDFTYANLAIRGRKLDAIVSEQLSPALAMAPDLVTIYAGANDIMRPRVDLDRLMESYDDALARLTASGARVVVFTAFDTGGSAVYAPVRGRFALYNELLRQSVEEHGATLVDFWRMRELRDWRHWDRDRMHLNAAGHQRIAIAVLDRLDVPHTLAPLPLGQLEQLDRRARLAHDLDWVRTHAVPWVHRRLTGRSSGDLVSARRPTLTPVE